ncbi:hypothetical protein VNO77_19133 [Canavalia gladiata]|uniref:Uncharacterized protein n=1 Tax=Canavalia gladiata TaxID=3824 RepID=A0AAN9LM76_CANGL
MRGREVGLDPTAFAKAGTEAATAHEGGHGRASHPFSPSPVQNREKDVVSAALEKVSIAWALGDRGAQLENTCSGIQKMPRDLGSAPELPDVLGQGMKSKEGAFSGGAKIETKRSGGGGEVRSPPTDIGPAAVRNVSVGGLESQDIGTPSATSMHDEPYGALDFKSYEQEFFGKLSCSSRGCLRGTLVTEEGNAQYSHIKLKLGLIVIIVCLSAVVARQAMKANMLGLDAFSMTSVLVSTNNFPIKWLESWWKKGAWIRGKSSSCFSTYERRFLGKFHRILVAIVRRRDLPVVQNCGVLYQPIVDDFQSQNSPGNHAHCAANDNLFLTFDLSNFIGDFFVMLTGGVQE